MGLDFTTIADHHGAALYILTGGSMFDKQKFERMSQEITKHTSHQVVLLDVKTPDGEKIRDFYDIMPERLPVVLVVRDDDSLAHMWSSTEIPSPDVISHHLKQISS